MKEMYLKSIRAIRFLFYRNLNINEQLEIANVLENENYLNLFWKLNQADRQHSFEVLNRTKKFSNEKNLLKLSLFHDIGKLKYEFSWLFRIFTELKILKTKKSLDYINHEEIGYEIIMKKLNEQKFTDFYKDNLLLQKNEILDITDF
jgi:hypothetical protein